MVTLLNKLRRIYRLTVIRLTIKVLIMKYIFKKLYKKITGIASLEKKLAEHDAMIQKLMAQNSESVNALNELQKKASVTESITEQLAEETKTLPNRMPILESMKRALAYCNNRKNN